MKSSQMLIGLAGLVVVGLIGFAITCPKPPSSLDPFARCLTQNGVKLFTTWWCPHCTNQKKLFGDAFQYLNNTECAAGLPSGSISQACRDLGVKSVPTWEFADGSRRGGVLSLETLSEATSCPLVSNP